MTKIMPQKKTDHLRPRVSDVGHASSAPAEAFRGRDKLVVLEIRCGGFVFTIAYTGCQHGCNSSLLKSETVSLNENTYTGT